MWGVASGQQLLNEYCLKTSENKRCQWGDCAHHGLSWKVEILWGRA